MEAAHDNNNSNCAFDNAMISSPTLPKNCYNESNDVHITEESIEVVDNHHRFEDDFGPETDVDAMDETTKMLQQLSELKENFLGENNPFKNDLFDQYSDDHVKIDQTAKSSDDSSTEVVVDNKIIDALESLAVTNGENEKHELEDETPERDLIDIRQDPDIPDLSEKVDCVHEKNMFMIDSVAKPDETFMQHSDSSFNQAENQDPSIIQDDTPDLTGTICLDESVGEDSEEEDEWNYIKGDKKSQEKHNPFAAENAEDSTQPSEIQSSASVVNFVISTGSNSVSEQLFDFIEENTAQKAEEVSAGNVKIDEPKDQIVETADSRTKIEDSVREALEDTAVSIEQELADYKNNSIFACSEEVSEYPDLSPFEDKLNCNSVSNLLLEDTTLSQLMKKSLPSSESVADTEVVVEDKPPANVVTEEVASSEIVATDLSSMIIVEEDTSSAEIVIEEAVGNQATEKQLSDITVETNVDEELERPDSLSLEMASKLNPEAKEFVPVSSPTRSNPTSPVANAPSILPNPFSMLDDTVVAQSPKKFTTTMDNIDLPAEDDFHHEMHRRPHELEKPSEYVNGNADVSVRSNSPVSEPSYQELNLKEAMQADEKLEHDYNDEKQVVTEDSRSEFPNEPNILNERKEQDPMNMSIYEGRDEIILSNSDELNKVHLLPELEDEVDEPFIADIDKAPADMHELTPTDALMVHLMEPEIILPTACEKDVQSKSPAAADSAAPIYAVASHMVKDVADLVSQIQIRTPNDGDNEQGEGLHLEEPVEITTDITNDNTKLDENRDIWISLDQQNEIEHLEDAIGIEVHSASHNSKPVANLHASEREELISPLEESSQNEVIAENEYITDESALNVQSPSQSMFSAEDPSKPELTLNERIKEPITTETTENVSVLPVDESIKTATTREPDTITPDLHLLSAVHDAEKLVDELKPIVTGLKSATTKTTAKFSTSSKPTASKTATAKTAKPAAPIFEKKTAKLSANTATTKPSSTSKPPTTNTIKKTSAVSSTSTTRTVKATKPSLSLTIGRSVTEGSATNKPPTEKKEPSTVKKPTMTSVNSEVKAGLVARKPTIYNKSTTIAKSSATSSASANSSRPSSTSVRSATAKPSTATTKSPTAASATSGSTNTVRTSSTVPTAKPRTVASTSSKTVSSTTTTSTLTSKSSSNAITKRFSTVGAVAPKLTTTTATTKTTTSVKTANTVASRTSTASKLSSTTATGVRKITSTSPTKPVSLSITKTRPSSGKSPASMKTDTSNYSNGKVSTEVCTGDLLDLNKQFKNDNNQLITQNGNDSQMMVIDSAAD